MKSSDVYIGMRAGWFTILSGPISKNGLRWEAECSCGAKVDLNISAIARKIAKNGSCQKCRFTRGSKHGHGSSKNITWGSWSAMKQRCYNPNNKSYPKYGGRGITVCDRWLESFENFLEDMGERPSSYHTIERIDNNGNYEPGNCRWATKKEQMSNTSRSVILEYQGSKFVGYKSLADHLGVKPEVLRGRAERGTLGRYNITRINQPFA